MAGGGVSKKRKSPILAPDGRPYVAPKPKPTVSIGGVDISSDVRSITFHSEPTVLSAVSILGRYFTSSSETPQVKPLAVAVADQIGALTADFDGASREELPAPERDLHTYRDAYASAAAKCLHDDAVELLYQRQWVCDDCGRTLNRDDMRRASHKRGSFWSYFR